MQIECQDCGERFRADIPSGAPSDIEVLCPHCRFPAWPLRSDPASGEAGSGPWGPESGTAAEPDDPLRRAEVLKILREEAEFAEAAKRAESPKSSKAATAASDDSAIQDRSVVKRTSDSESVRRRGSSRSNSGMEALREDERSGWARAAAAVLIALLVAAAFAYNYSSEIVERIPAAAPYLESFTRLVDDASLRIAELL